MANAQTFRQHIYEAEIIDPDGTHHEFASGMHGRKIDFDEIPNDSPLSQEWVGVAAEFISGTYTRRQLGDSAIVSVANGTNRIVPAVVERLGLEPNRGLLTEKVGLKPAALSKQAIENLHLIQPSMAVILEDVGTTGLTTADISRSLSEHVPGNVEVVITWQRRETLEELDDLGIAYRAIIKEILPTFTPQDCVNLAEGYCYMDWELIPRQAEFPQTASS